MKISKLFHWLYFFIMSLPLVVIPIFGIYSHRHTIDSYTVEVSQNEVIDFNQLYGGSNLVNLNTTTNNVTISTDLSDVPTYSLSGVADASNTFFNLMPYNSLNGFTNSHKYLVKYTNTAGYGFDYPYLSFFGFGINYRINFTSSETIFDTPSTLADGYYFRIQIDGTIDASDTLINIQVFDLTQMFGVGNEPTISDFNSYFPNDYYSYTLSDKQLLKDVGTITYNNTDIGSQLTYAIYTPLHDYYNFNNFSTFNDVYNWIQLTFFNGNAPLGFFIVWECMCYWLMISIFWLIFDIFLYVPMLAHRWLDKASLS